MRFILGAVLFYFSSHGTAGAHGGTVENGGNAIVCRETSNSPGPGEVVVVDYLRALASGATPEEFAFVGDWRSSQGRLAQILLGVSNGLFESFVDFADSTDQIQTGSGSRGLRRHWYPRKAGLNFGDLPAWPVPQRCHNDTVVVINGVKVHIDTLFTLRAVTREQRGADVLYFFEPEIIARLTEREDILQFSMLMIHEWLWDHTNSLDVNQAVNGFLHSRAIERMSPKAVRAKLRSLGLRF